MAMVVVTRESGPLKHGQGRQWTLQLARGPTPGSITQGPQSPPNLPGPVPRKGSWFPGASQGLKTPMLVWNVGGPAPQVPPRSGPVPGASLPPTPLTLVYTVLGALQGSLVGWL